MATPFDAVVEIAVSRDSIVNSAVIEDSIGMKARTLKIWHQNHSNHSNSLKVYLTSVERYRLSFEHFKA